MPARYYHILNTAEAPPDAAIIHLREDGPGLLAELDLGDGAPETMPADLALFRAGLALVQHDLVGIFVCFADPRLWQNEWGCLSAYTLNLNSITSPSLTT